MRRISIGTPGGLPSASSLRVGYQEGYRDFNDDYRSVGDGLGTVACECRTGGTLRKGEDLTRSTG
jgi:hypothetical protein